MSGLLKGKLPLFLILACGVLAGGGIAAVTFEPDSKVQAASAPSAFIPALDNTPGFPDVKGGDFSLTDQHGNSRTSTNPNGQFQLLFFGYAQCKAICTVALPNIAQATDLLKGMGHDITPVMITVDPKRDTVPALRREAPKMHPRMVGLTGGEDALNAAYGAFQVQKQFVFDHPDEGPIYTHGSFVYLLDGAGNFKTLFPPIISPVRIAEITASYIAEEGDG